MKAKEFDLIYTGMLGLWLFVWLFFCFIYLCKGWGAGREGRQTTSYFQV